MENCRFKGYMQKDSLVTLLPGLEEETFWVIGTHANEYNKKLWQDQVKIFFNYAELMYHKEIKFVDSKFT